MKENRAQELDVKAFLDRLMEFTVNDVYRAKLRIAKELLAVDADRRTIVRLLGNGVEAFNSVPTAIYCFLRKYESFRETMVYAISLGGDTDTIASMTGAISGAYHGVNAIPKEWLEKLERKDYIKRLAEELWKLKTGIV
ncbi:ADP-ribosylglycohydrolase family protein [Candidatus Bathyarchaeota archaeon]|nr:ADP-ribosylglycohydrolase family protein [Candidatus Bathyarchaeota archaeon]